LRVAVKVFLWQGNVLATAASKLLNSTRRLINENHELTAD